MSNLQARQRIFDKVLTALREQGVASVIKETRLAWIDWMIAQYRAQGR